MTFSNEKSCYSTSIIFLSAFQKGPLSTIRINIFNFIFFSLYFSFVLYIVDIIDYFFNFGMKRWIVCADLLINSLQRFIIKCYISLRFELHKTIFQVRDDSSALQQWPYRVHWIIFDFFSFWFCTFFFCYFHFVKILLTFQSFLCFFSGCVCILFFHSFTNVYFTWMYLTWSRFLLVYFISFFFCYFSSLKWTYVQWASFCFGVNFY